jgi:hypothetical protein
MKLYKNQKVLLRKNMKMATVVKKVTNKDKWIVTYYDQNNKFVYDVISEIDIIDDLEYEIIKRRINLINKILAE